MAEDPRKKQLRKYPTEQLPGSPMPMIATHGVNPARAGQPSTEKRAPGELSSPYRPMIEGVDAFRKQNPRYGGPGSFRNQIPGPSAGDMARRYVGALKPTTPTGARSVSSIDRRGAGTPKYPSAADQLAWWGNKGQQLTNRIRGVFNQTTDKKAQGLLPSPATQGVTPGFPWPQNTPARPEPQPQGPAQGPVTQHPKQAHDMQQRANRALGREEAPTRKSESAGVMPGEAWRQMHENMGPFPADEAYGSPKVLKHKGGEPIIISKPGHYQLPRYTPTEQEKEAPIHVLKGNQESYWDPKTAKRFATLGEAFRGEEAGLTYERAAKAAEREYGLEKIREKGKVDAANRSDWKYVDDTALEGGQGPFLYNKYNPKERMSATGPDPVAAAVAGVKTREDLNAITKGMDRDAKMAVINRLTPEQLQALRKKK